MSMLVMAQPVSHTAFKREFAWDENRQSDYHLPSRPRGEPERIALPSIRQAIPELQLRILPAEGSNGSLSNTTSPVVGLGGAMTPPEYVHSPNQNKRRRLSFGQELEVERASQVPRLYASPQRDSQAPSSRGMSPTLAVRTTTDNWASSSRASPYVSQSGSLSSMQSPVTMEVSVERIEPRPTLPSLPHLSFDRATAPIPRTRGHSTDEGYPRPMAFHPGGPGMDAPSPAYRQGGYNYGGYHHPTRVQSLSLGSINPFDRTPFSAGSGFGQHYQEYMRIGELGAMSMNGDNKQRKRRGNLPKETTDKLRAWFVAHLQHPYPTEDEKQELMRQTGLQMNQISNWFINARRRQLPSMINNARAESDALSAARGSDGKVLPSTERHDYEDGKRRESVPLSDGEGSGSEDDLESLERRRAGNMKRGSV